MTMSFGNGWGMGGGFFMIFFWVLLIIFVLVAARWAMGNGSQGGGQSCSPREPTALEILEQRYARGEIEREEFEQKKRDLLDR